MAGRLGTKADVLMTESVLGHILESIDSMLLEKDLAGVFLVGERISDASGDFVSVTGISDSGGIGLCVGSSQGGTEPTDDDLALLKQNIGSGILMKADVFAHQFSMYKVNDTVEDATVLFVE